MSIFICIFALEIKNQVVMDKYSIYLNTPEMDWIGDFNSESEAMAFFENFDYRCDKECVGKEKILYHGENEIARATIKNLTIFK
jgi:hypothetical protein